MEATAVIPRQKKGARSDTARSIKLSSVLLAEKLYETAKEQLLRINEWHAMAGGGAVFQLVNRSGDLLYTKAQKGNFIRIEIPALPASTAGKGHEWVEIEMIREEIKSAARYCLISVRPATPPLHEEHDVAHFFSKESTSNFIVEQSGKTVIVAVKGRNEVPNIHDTHSIWSRIRNTIVGLGAMLGLNKPQWRTLIKGIIRKSRQIAGI